MSASAPLGVLLNLLSKRLSFKNEKGMFSFLHIMIFNLSFDLGSCALTAWELLYWVTNKARDCSFKNFKAYFKLRSNEIEPIFK